MFPWGRKGTSRDKKIKIFFVDEQLHVVSFIFIRAIKVWKLEKIGKRTGSVKRSREGPIYIVVVLFLCEVWRSFPLELEWSQ